MIETLSMRQKLTQIISSPLIASYNTLQDLPKDALDQTDKNIYFGTGLATPKEMSLGLPFDYLIMPITAEFLRRETGAGVIIQEISDTHCVSNGLASTKEVAELAEQERNQVNRLMDAVGMRGTFYCRLASNYQNDSRFDACKAAVDERAAPNDNDYCRLQWAGDYYMATYRRVGLKLGWLTDDSENVQGKDERYFNRNFQTLDLPGPKYAYTSCGIDWDNSRTRVSPYTRTRNEKRPMLAYDRPMIDIITENKQQVSDKTHYQAMRNMALIVDNFESLFGTLSDAEIWSDQKAANTNNVLAVKNDCPWAGGKSINVPVLCDKADIIRKMCL